MTSRWISLGMVVSLAFGGGAWHPASAQVTGDIGGRPDFRNSYRKCLPDCNIVFQACNITHSSCRYALQDCGYIGDRLQTIYFCKQSPESLSGCQNVLIEPAGSYICYNYYICRCKVNQNDPNAWNCERSAASAGSSWTEVHCVP